MKNMMDFLNTNTNTNKIMVPFLVNYLGSKGVNWMYRSRMVKNLIYNRLLSSDLDKFYDLKESEFKKIKFQLIRLIEKSNKLRKLGKMPNKGLGILVAEEYKSSNKLMNVDIEQISYDEIRRKYRIGLARRKLMLKKYQVRAEKESFKRRSRKEKEKYLIKQEKRWALYRRRVVQRMSESTKMLIINLFLGSIIRKGKRLFAEKMLFNILTNLRRELSALKIKETPLYVFLLAIENIKPLMKMRAKIIGGRVYRLPKRGMKRELYQFAIKWIIAAAKERVYEKSICEKLTYELLDNYKNKGGAVIKREQFHKGIIDARPFLKYL